MQELDSANGLYHEQAAMNLFSLSVFFVYLSRELSIVDLIWTFSFLDKATGFKSYLKPRLTSLFGKLAKGLMMVAKGTWHCLARSAVQGRA